MSKAESYSSPRASASESASFHRRPKVHLSSLGCPKNQVDAEVMLGKLVAEGYEVTLDPDDADVMIVNTCSFIQPAKEESIETILEMAGRKDARGAKLVVTGCLAERYGKELVAEMPEVDAFVGTGDFLRLPDVLRDLGSTGDRLARRRGAPLAYVGAKHVLPDARVPRILTGQPFSAYLKVSEGCNHRCAFCIIPKIRGGHESRQIADLVAEATALARQGVREINLIAQDLTAYGRDLGEPSSLAALLGALARVDGIHWIRLLYCYPNFVTSELLDAIADSPKVCRYIDMPLQHGSDRMLRAMRRERSADSLRRLIERIRRRLPDMALRTSFIVGFPGETEADFIALCRFVEEIEFERVGIFRYSQEENTDAGSMPDQVSESVKEARWHTLMQIQRQVSRRRNAAWIGREVTVLACGEDDDGRPYGRTEAQAPEIDGVVFLAGDFAPGELAAVHIDSSDDYDLFGARVGETPGVDRELRRP
jgi:ribosomal protein S12 methylthiotransferase